MDTVEKKSTRAPNFSSNEKNTLLNLVNSYKGIIENKKTNAVTWREKTEAWQEITNLFNSQSPDGHHRSKESLKKFYENIKKGTRKYIAAERREVYLTGSGTAQMPPQDPNLDLALGLMNQKSVGGLLNRFDSDNMGFENPSASRTMDEEEVCATITSHEKESLEGVKIPEEVDTSAMRIIEQTSRCTGNSSFISRRRPAMTKTSGQLSEEYIKVAKIKLEYFEAEKKLQIARNENAAIERDILNVQKQIVVEELRNLKEKNEREKQRELEEDTFRRAKNNAELELLKIKLLHAKNEL